MTSPSRTNNATSAPQRGRQSARSSAPQTRSDLRRDRIVREVAPLFLKRGYDNVSINEIVELVGGSKTTIYSLFGGKDGLLEATVRYMTSKVTYGIDVRMVGTIEQQLTRIARSFLRQVLDPEVLTFHRLMVSIGRAFPIAGRAFFETGPMVAASIVAEWITKHQNAGRLPPGDPQLLAQLFLDMLIGEHQLGWLTSQPGACRPERIERTIELAVRVFLGNWAAAVPASRSAARTTARQRRSK